LNPSYKLGKRVLLEEKPVILKKDFEKYLILRELEGISKKWFYQTSIYLQKYLKYVNWKIDENKTYEYYRLLKDTISISYYKKEVYQIKKFLSFLEVEWANSVKLPPDPFYPPTRVSYDEIKEAIRYFENHPFYLQAKAIIFLGMSTGARALELYQLRLEDIDLDNKVVRINHNPKNGQTTKTRQSRVSFFNEETKQAVIDYLEHYDQNSNLKKLFSQSHITRLFKDAPIQVKYLRKYFSQEWDRRGGPTSIKKILMGHSLKGDVDLQHYNAQSDEDLRKIYFRVMGSKY